MRVSAVRNLNLNKAKKHVRLDFLGAEKSTIHPESTSGKEKNVNYLPRMLATIGIGMAILWGTARLFKDKTAPISYLWK
ncbi:hypothetical protein IKA15_00190 [bacterium]|nr:hypothetical protein [bacterium]